MLNRGKFIVLEGIDGVGTTSMANEIQLYFSARDVPMQSSKEPYSAELEGLLHKFISGEFPDPGWRPMSLLFSADRHLHCRDLDEVLAGGMNVVCDRYSGSTAAYQSSFAAEDEREAALAYIMDHLCDGLLVPDLIIYIRGDVEVCHVRVCLTRSRVDYYERLELQHRVSSAYEKWVQKEIQNNGDSLIVVVDGTRSYDEVRADCLSVVDMLFSGSHEIGAMKNGPNPSESRHRTTDARKEDSPSRST